jgi:hypothetical protein
MQVYVCVVVELQLYQLYDHRVLHNNALREVYNNNNNKFKCKWAVARWQWLLCMYYIQWHTQEFCSGGGGGCQQIKLRTDVREKGDLEAVAP